MVEAGQVEDRGVEVADGFDGEIAELVGRALAEVPLCAGAHEPGGESGGTAEIPRATSERVKPRPASRRA
jgi:hypothetical protein